jgi:hypothetical protein
LDQQADRDVVTFKIEDYMNAMEGIKFLLSPYYDGMKATAAVMDIVRRSGFPEGRIHISEDSDPTTAYGLPFVNAFEEPQFRFKDGSSLKSGIVKIAQLHGRTAYFDQFGDFHYDPVPGSILNDDPNMSPVARFYSSIQSTQNGKDLIWNVKSTTRNVNDIFNAFVVSTIDRETGGIVHVGENIDAAIQDPNATGYLGYRKIAIFRDPVLGSVEAATNYLRAYSSKMFIPPRTTHFQTYGRPEIKPLDIITVDDRLFRIVNISSQIDKQSNNYFMNVEGEWFDTVGS